jgi:polysaccharide chain length determinant protein (PEP-CTERM system associated)
MPLHELLTRVLAEIRSAWRFRWYGAAAAWVVYLAGWGVAAWLPNIYEARARVYVDASSALRPVLSNQIIVPDIATQLTYVRQALLGREHLERVMRDNELDVAVRTDAELEQVLDQLREDIGISSASTTDSVYTITYQHAERDKAISVVDTLVNSLVEATLRARQQGTDTAERFLNERIREYENRLQQAETARADFKKRNAERLPGSEGGYFERMRMETEALETARKNLRLAETRRERLVEQLSSQNPVVPTMSSAAAPPPNSVDARIREYQAQLDRLLLEYTEQHPDVINTRQSLANLERQRTEQLAALGVREPGAELSSLDANPIYQTLRIALNDIEVEIDTLEEDVRERTQKLDQLQTLVDEVPEVEAELARLNRDYDVIYEQYQAMVRSRETQELSRKASDSDDVEFNVIDPPRADFEPVAPDRLMLLFAAFIVALASGGGVCWLLAQLNPVFSSVAALRAAAGLPVLGAVSQVWEGQNRVRRRVVLLGFAGAMAGLAMLLLAGVAIEAVGPGIHNMIKAL